MNYIVANWKSNKRFEDVWRWFDEFSHGFIPSPTTTTIIAPADCFIFESHKKINELKLSGVSLASQNISPFPFGAYTGAVSASMLTGIIDYAIIGHSERREYFKETHTDVANKVAQLLEHGITPILCVDQPYAKAQLNALEKPDWDKLIIAYEPLEAIGSGKPQDPNEVLPVVKQLSKLSSSQTPILYGGSVKDHNAHTYMHLSGVSGLLVGGASLDATGFARLISQTG